MSDQSSDINRISLIQAITTPLGFFVMCVTVIEGAIFGGLALHRYPDSITPFLAYAGVGILILLIFVVAAIAIGRPGVLTGEEQSSDTLGFSLGTTIFHSIDGYISNLESEQERQEAYEVLILAIERRSDKAHRKVRLKIGEVIREASDVHPKPSQEN